MSDELLLPYPGLRPFASDESYLFFGRDGCVGDMLGRMGQTRFLAVLGASGSGKSSLVRTGLFDALYVGDLPRAGSRWKIADMKPGSEPMANLARALIAAVRDIEPADQLAIDDDEVALLRAYLKRGPRSIVQWCKNGNLPTYGDPPKSWNLLILADQFEELFRYETYADREEAEAFVALLLESVKWSEEDPAAPRIYVTMTMRSEYLGACALLPGLAEAINAGLYLTPRMTRAECREAIEGPAGVCGFEVEGGLVNRLLNDLAEFAPWQEDDQSNQLERLSRRSDQLPLMQHALNRIWLRQSAGHDDPDDVTLTLAEYEAIGGIKGALDGHANEVFGTLTEAGRAVAPSVFRALVMGTSIADAVRRPTPFSQIVALAGGDRDAVLGVVEAFRAPDCNFLMPPVSTPITDQTFIDISHESLIRQWDELTAWLQIEARGATVWRRLLNAMERHERGEGGLLRDLDLETVRRWRDEEQPTEIWAQRYGGHYETAIAFLDKSIAAEEAAEKAAEEERVRGQRQRRLAIAGTVWATALTIGFGAVGYLWYQANIAREVAVNALEIAQVEREAAEEARELAEASRQAAIRNAEIADEFADAAREAAERAEANYQATIEGLIETLGGLVVTAQEDGNWSDATDLVADIARRKEQIGAFDEAASRRLDASLSSRAIVQSHFGITRIPTFAPNREIDVEEYTGVAVYPHTAPRYVIYVTRTDFTTEVSIVDGLTGSVRSHVSRSFFLGSDVYQSVFLLNDERTLVLISDDLQAHVIDIDAPQDTIVRGNIRGQRVGDVVRDANNDEIVIVSELANGRTTIDLIPLDGSTVRPSSVRDIPSGPALSVLDTIVSTPDTLVAIQKNDGEITGVYTADRETGAVDRVAGAGVFQTIKITLDSRLFLALIANPSGAACDDFGALMSQSGGGGSSVFGDAPEKCLVALDMTTEALVWSQGVPAIEDLLAVDMRGSDDEPRYAALLVNREREHLELEIAFAADGATANWSDPRTEDWHGYPVTDVQLVYFITPDEPYRDVLLDEGGGSLTQYPQPPPTRGLILPTSSREQVVDLARAPNSVRLAYPVAGEPIAVYRADPLTGAVSPDTAFPEVDWEDCFDPCEVMTSAFSGDGRLLLMADSNGALGLVRADADHVVWITPSSAEFADEQRGGDAGGERGGQQNTLLNFVIGNLYPVDAAGDLFLAREFTGEAEVRRGRYHFLRREQSLDDRSDAPAVRWLVEPLGDDLQSLDLLATDPSTGRMLFVERVTGRMRGDRLVMVDAATNDATLSVPLVDDPVTHAAFLDDGRVVVAAPSGVIRVFVEADAGWQEQASISSGVPRILEVGIDGDLVLVVGDAFREATDADRFIAIAFDLGQGGIPVLSARIDKTPTKAALLGTDRVIYVAWGTDEIESVWLQPALDPAAYADVARYQSSEPAVAYADLLNFAFPALARTAEEAGAETIVIEDALRDNCERALDARLRTWSTFWAENGQISDSYYDTTLPITGCAGSDVAVQVDLFNQLLGQSVSSADLLTATSRIAIAGAPGGEVLMSMALNGIDAQMFQSSAARLALEVSPTGMGWSVNQILDWLDGSPVAEDVIAATESQVGRPYANLHWVRGILAERRGSSIADLRQALFSYALAERLYTTSDDEAAPQPLIDRRASLARTLLDETVSDVRRAVIDWTPEPLDPASIATADSGTDAADAAELQRRLEELGIDPAIVFAIDIIAIETQGDDLAAAGDQAGAADAYRRAAQMALDALSDSTMGTLAARLSGLADKLANNADPDGAVSVALSALERLASRYSAPIPPDNSDLFVVQDLFRVINGSYPQIADATLDQRLATLDLPFLDYAWWATPWRDEPEARRTVYSMFRDFEALATTVLERKPEMTLIRARRGQILFWMDEYIRFLDDELDVDSRTGFLRRAVDDMTQARSEDPAIPDYVRYALAEGLRVYASEPVPELKTTADRNALRRRSVEEHIALFNDGFLDRDPSVSFRNFFEGAARAAAQGAIDANYDLAAFDGGNDIAGATNTALEALEFAWMRAEVRRLAEKKRALRAASSGWDVDMRYDDYWGYSVGALAGILRHANQSPGIGANECDVMASFPYDAERRAPGTRERDIDVDPAIAACREAIAAEPQSGHYAYLVGRTLAQRENIWEAPFLHLTDAARRGNAAAFELIAANLDRRTNLVDTDDVYPLSDSMGTAYAQRTAISGFAAVIEPLIDAASSNNHADALVWLTRAAGNLGVAEAHLVLARVMLEDPGDRARHAIIAGMLFDQRDDSDGIAAAQAVIDGLGLDGAALDDALRRAERFQPEAPVPLPADLRQQIAEFLPN